jgi:hypothetical protein
LYFLRILKIYMNF